MNTIYSTTIQMNVPVSSWQIEHAVSYVPNDTPTRYVRRTTNMIYVPALQSIGFWVLANEVGAEKNYLPDLC